MRRHLIGILAILLLLGVVYFWMHPPQEEEAWTEQLKAACSRGGALAGVIWLAYPSLHRVPRWLLGLLLAGAAIIAVKPRLALWAIPIIAALAILKPRVGKRR